MSQQPLINDSLALSAQRIRQDLQEQNANPVRVGLFGLGGAGKSSLVNALVGKKVMAVSPMTDCTLKEQRAMHNGIEFVDLPGFGTERFRGENFEAQFKVAESFDVLLLVQSAGVKILGDQADLFKRAMARSKANVFVVTKCATLLQEDKTTEELQREVAEDVRTHLHAPDLPVHFVSTLPTNIGLDELQRAIYSVLDVAKRERWAKGAKAYSKAFLAAKREACEGLVTRYAALAAANGLNPVPGLDVAIDLGTMLNLFKEIRDAYGLSPARLKWLESQGGKIAVGVLSNVARFAGPASKEALLTLLKRFAGRQAAKQVSKYIPIIGQMVAASLGFGITYWAGKEYLDECEALAQAVLDADLKWPSALKENDLEVIDAEVVA